MAFYQYQCQDCFYELPLDVYAGIGISISNPCPCCGGLLVRRCSFTFRRSMPEHFNTSTGAYVSNERDFRDGLKRKSEEMSIRTGMTHNYQPVDVTDMKALGVTDDGLEETKRRRRAENLDPPSTTKVII